MPAIRHASKRKAPPAGFSDIEDSLLVFANKMKDAENAPNTAAPKHQALWPIFQVAHQRSSGRRIVMRSCVVYAAYKPRKQTSTRHAYAASRKRI
ncbi:hypothetical protein V490_03043 [Pseudogymnoascus sp. VKM F-3557]|nr:hypothetical protein V490_03043 [Pseudogymnoascus sp. VKM F-3557]